MEHLLQRGVHELTQRFIHETMGAPMRKAVKYEQRHSASLPNPPCAMLPACHGCCC